MALTQTEKILAHLQAYGSITSLESFKLYCDTRLSDKIYRLKKQGYTFTEKWEKSKNGIKFKRYILGDWNNGKSNEM